MTEIKFPKLMTLGEYTEELVQRYMRVAKISRSEAIDTIMFSLKRDKKRAPRTGAQKTNSMVFGERS